MKKIMLLAAALIVQQPVFAGSVAGTGGATEITQMENFVKLAASYVQQVESYVRQGLQYEAQLQNLIKNPVSIMGPDVARLVNGISNIMDVGQSIGGTVARIDRRFGEVYKNPKALSFSKNFQAWTDVSKDSLQASMKAAGLVRDAYSTNKAALEALYNESQNSDGNIRALQTLSKINTEQIQQTMALSDLIATQNIATSTYLASQTSKEEIRAIGNSQIMQFGKPADINAADYINKF